jgi:hypothetical protein
MARRRRTRISITHAVELDDMLFLVMGDGGRRTTVADGAMLRGPGPGGAVDNNPVSAVVTGLLYRRCSSLLTIPLPLHIRGAYDEERRLLVVP